MEVVWNVIPIRVLLIRLILDTLAQIGFQTAFWIILNATHNDNVKTGDGNTGSIHTLFISAFSWVLHCYLTGCLFGERSDAPSFFPHTFWKPRHIQYMDTPMSLPKQPLSGQTNLILSLAIDSIESLSLSLSLWSFQSSSFVVIKQFIGTTTP